MLGTFIGFFFGYLITKNIYGVVIGGALGYYFYDRQFSQRAKISPADLQQAQNLFFNTVFTLLGHLAKADGRVSEEEIKLTEVLMDRMELTPDHRREAIRLFKEGTLPTFQFDATLDAFRALGVRSPNLSQMLLVYLVNLAMVDGEVDANEMRVLQEVSDRLGFSRIAFEQLLRMIGAQNNFSKDHTPNTNDLALAYAALGVSEQDSDADIKKAYRKLMSQYHPDKLIGQGVPQDMIKAATERSQEIQAAYDVIKKARG